MTKIWLNQRYQLLRPLGKGGFAQTYLAIDHQRSQLPCVIKQLMPANSSPKFLATARRLFKSEVEAMRRLGDYNSIPELLDAFESEEEFYFVQEFIDGESLSDVFKQSRFGETETVDFLRAVLSTLTFIHQEQVIHRDIKPSNLMRRCSDGQYMLIDFGAVKEITTDVYLADSEQFTVSIGTQGYAAPEQMAGRPRYSSDLYALGMTVIHGLTGRSPTELPENPLTGELLWDTNAPAISPGLKVFLQRLTQVSIYQRYPSAAAALADLEQYEQLATSASEMPQTILGPSAPGPNRRQYRPWRPALVALGVLAIVLMIRQLGGWVPIELWLHDQWVQRQPLPTVDDRLLVVEITEADLMRLQQTTPSDAVLATAIATLQAHDAQVIGLDLYRDIPQGEGHDQLLAALAAENVIAIRQLGGSLSERIPAPRGVPPEQVGFNDFPVDDDGVVRRKLLFASVDEQPEAEVLYSFALRLALAYLQPRNADIAPLASEINPDYMDINGRTFIPLDPHFGGYRHLDAAGYQIMLQYRGAAETIPTMSLNELLEGQFQSDMIRDRVVLIGTTAASAKDFFLTPYSATADEDFLMSGVMLHAHATSQILSASLDAHPLPWAWPEAVEVLWIVGGATGGVVLGSQGKRLWVLGLGLVVGSVILVGVPITIGLLAGWMPVAPGLVAFAGGAIATALVRNEIPKS